MPCHNMKSYFLKQYTFFCCPECSTAYEKKEERKTDAFKKKSKKIKQIIILNIINKHNIYQ